MRSENEHTDKIEDISYKELRALEEIEENPELTQRQLSRKMGVALGVGNLLLKNLAKKGYIKVTHLSWKRWIYVVTPKGMTRKVNLTLAYIDSFLGHYKKVKKILKENLNSLTLNKESKVAIIGTGELAELAYLALLDIGVDEIDMYGDDDDKPVFLGMDVRYLRNIEVNEYSKIVVTSVDLESVQTVIKEKSFDSNKIVGLLKNGQMVK
tara:strand:- start:659 stop:1288 length:630 start_codon:yes stop_codon:yes gene_type:complete